MRIHACGRPCIALIHCVRASGNVGLPRCSELPEGYGSGLEPLRSELLLTAIPTGFTKPHPGHGCLVRSPDLSPELHGTLQLRTGNVRIARGELEPSPGVGGVGRERLAAKFRRNLRQLLDGHFGALQVTRSAWDHYLSLQKGRPPKLRRRRQLFRGDHGRILKSTANGSGGEIRPGAREVDERQTGLGVPPERIGLEKRLLRAIEVTLSKSNTSQLIERPSQFPPEVWLQFVDSRQDLVLRSVVLASEPQYLGTMNSAATVDAADRLAVVPPFIASVHCSAKSNWARPGGRKRSRSRRRC